MSATASVVAIGYEQGSVDESPDQILARLERHAESVRRAGKAAAAAPPERAAPPLPTTSTGLPSRALLRDAPPKAPPVGALIGRPAVPRTARPGPTAVSAGPAPPAVAPPAAPPGTLVVHWGGERVADLIPDESFGLPRFGLMLRTVAGQALAVICCILALLASIYLSMSVAMIVVGVAAVAAGVLAIRKVPFTGWCTLGLVIGWTLGRFS